MRKTLLACALLASCEMQPPVHERAVPFDPAEYEPYSVDGTGSVEGQAFMRQRGGGVVTGAGSKVWLVPATSYAKEEHLRGFLHNERLANPDPRAHGYWRGVLADADGRFRFERVPGGEYFVYCEIAWEYVGSNGFARNTGGIAGAQIALADGESLTNVIVTR